MRSEKFKMTNTVLWVYLATALTVLKPAAIDPLERCEIQSITPGQGTGSILRAVLFVLRQTSFLKAAVGPTARE